MSGWQWLQDEVRNNKLNLVNNFWIRLRLTIDSVSVGLPMDRVLNCWVEIIDQRCESASARNSSKLLVCLRRDYLVTTLGNGRHLCNRLATSTSLSESSIVKSNSRAPTHSRVVASPRQWEESEVPAIWRCGGVASMLAQDEEPHPL